MELSARESEVNHELVKGFQVKEIATRLFISPYTVDTHIKNIKKKTGAKNIADLVRNFILSNPQKFFTALVFIALQVFITFSNPDTEMRRTRTARRVARVKQAKKRT
ncbi:response regulator transcription factor [Tenacibaculum piscium]|uniref:response regulator transcription factor n=1 Tax=Tenacibaculum piscium TaxID=1458515 RepID=UPI00187B83C6|nr:helix-turn-helix transcriptional regulator [Tenacibaculum piscium]MBE7691294.1 hypothetical protein [Tenacibaculum piscium]